MKKEPMASIVDGEIEVIVTLNFKVPVKNSTKTEIPLAEAEKLALDYIADGSIYKGEISSDQLDFK